MSIEKFDEAKKFQARLKQLFVHFLGKERGGQAFLREKTGLGAGTINEWLRENNPTTPDQSSIRRISEKLGVSIEWLATGRGRMIVDQALTTAYTASDLRKAEHIVDVVIKALEGEKIFSRQDRDAIVDLVLPGVVMGLPSEPIQRQLAQLIEKIRAAGSRIKPG